MTDTIQHFLPISTKEGWSRFVSDDPPQPPKISHAEREAQTAVERESYDNCRRRFMTSGIVRTPAFDKILISASSRLRMNEFKYTGKLGLIVSGEPSLGKTTTVTQIGKLHTLRRQHQDHSAGQPGCIPVVYITVPPACGPKAMIAEFAEFFGLPTNGRISQSTLLNSVSQVMARVRTELVIVDEIHNLNVNYRMSADASDALKQLSEKCAATFIYAGVNVESSGLLDGARGKQTSSRFELHRVVPFGNLSTKHRDEWQAVLLSLEQTLCLTRQRDGDILAHSARLFADTGGSIGRLVDTLHLAALTAIDDHSERLTLAADTATRATKAPTLAAAS